jgi:hemerythrin-like domain-containing protein
MHHDIEEAHVFPRLAQRMPIFSRKPPPSASAADKEEAGLMCEQHKAIHKGLVLLEDYLKACKKGEEDFRMDELKRRMDTFGTVLWAHLAKEVEQLGAENMRKYWSVEDMRRLAF